MATKRGNSNLMKDIQFLKTTQNFYSKTIKKQIPMYRSNTFTKDFQKELNSNIALIYSKRNL